MLSNQFECFELPTPSARESAECVISRYPESMETMTTFAGQLMGTLTMLCFVDHKKSEGDKGEDVGAVQRS